MKRRGWKTRAWALALAVALALALPPAAGQAVLADLTAELRRMIPANLTLYTGVSQAEETCIFAAVALQVTVKHVF